MSDLRTPLPDLAVLWESTARGQWTLVWMGWDADEAAQHAAMPRPAMEPGRAVVVEMSIAWDNLPEMGDYGAVMPGTTPVIAVAPEPRYWYDERRGYLPLSEFGPVLRAIHKAAPDVFLRLHRREPSLEQRTREIAERTGMSAYLVDDETWAAAEAEAHATSRSQDGES